MQSHARTMQNLTMQRRHFQLIADVLRAEKPDTEGKAYEDRTPWAKGAHDEWSTVVLNMAAALVSTNLNFNRQRFLDACGME